MLPEEEKQLILPLDTFDFLRRAAALYGDKIGIVDQSKRFTYAQLLQRCTALASNISSLELAKSDVVSIIDYNSHHLLESYYGLLSAGVVINPLNFRYSSDDLVYMINYAKSRAVFVHRDFMQTVRKIEGEIPTVKHIVVLEGENSDLLGANYHSYEELTDNLAQPLHEGTVVDENDPAELLFTSGTTRCPKCVPLTHRNLYLNALFTIIAYRLTDEDTVLHVVPLFHSNGGGTPQTITAVGGKHVMLRKVDAEDMLRLIEAEGVTMFVAVPTVIDRLLSHPNFNNFDTSSMRRIIVIGTLLTPNLMKRVETRMPSCECISAYGMTETGPLVALARPKQHERKMSMADQLKLRCATGYEVIGAQVRVVDKEMNDVAPNGQSVGEIVVRGNSIFNGYYNDLQTSSETIVNGWFRTGDLALLREGGWVVAVDRAKDMIKSGGENISSLEVEEIIRMHPSVSDAAVIGIPDDLWGEVPKAIVELKPNNSLTEAALLDYCRNNLTHFKVPKSVKFVTAFPRTATGKISKSKLREEYWRGREIRIH